MSQIKEREIRVSENLFFRWVLYAVLEDSIKDHHGIYSFRGRSLGADNIFPCGMCYIIFADIYPKHPQLKPLYTHPSHQHTHSHSFQLPAIFKIIVFCHNISPLLDFVWCKLLHLKINS
uniref:Uncharacterized protein n=1 Tax=Mus spicilegus TaxID=10103 RepID=A0A8C6IK08_MUSSI